MQRNNSIAKLITAEVAICNFGTLTAIDRRCISPRMLPVLSHSLSRTVLLVTFALFNASLGWVAYHM